MSVHRLLGIGLLAALAGGIGASVGSIAGRDPTKRALHATLVDFGGVADGVTAVLSALALLGVSFALILQVRQTRISGYDFAGGIRSDLMKFAIENPRHLASWGYDTTDIGRAQTWAYTSLVLSYMKMAYELGRLTKLELTLTCERIFRNDEVAECWPSFRAAYHHGASRFGRRDFANIVDDAYERRSPHPPDGSPDPDDDPTS